MLEKDTTEAETKSLPKWVVSLFSEFLDHQENLNHVLHLSIQGISMLRGRANALAVLSKYQEDGDHDSREITAESIKQAEAERDLAQTEVDTGFPILHEQATVALWSSLEALIRRFVAVWLENRPDAWQTEQVRKLKVRVGDYMPLDHSERSIWVVDLLDQDIGGPLRSGVSRFESLLEPFGFSGSTNDEVQKILFELAQVRNVIVHRNGNADKRLLDACPWLGVRLGEKIRVTHKMWESYNVAVTKYVTEVIQRSRTRHGMERHVPSPESSEGV